MVNILKFRTPKKGKTLLNLFSLLTTEAKGSNQFWLLPFLHRIFGIFLFEIKILLFQFLEH